MEEQMTRADKLASIGELSAGIAHEINNPLGIILGYAQLLLRSQTEGTETYDDLKTIEKHVKSCKVIVEDLLNFARSSKPEKDAVDIHALIDDVVDFIQQHAGSMQLTINKDYDLSLPRLVLDEKKIKQVFINLIMNAKHAVDDKGVIQIMTRFDRESGQAQLEVSDNGSGIDSRNVKKIFDPFFTTKPTGEGTGLGLSVSYGIVKNHGGDIRVHSTVGKGTTFTIALPAVA
jgi:signal transduction histidine kinase